MAHLNSIAPNLWVHDTSFSLPKGLLPIGVPGFLGKCRLRMTVVRLESGDVLLHSPTRPIPLLVEEIKSLGEVKCIIGPCVMHTTYILEWQKLFPNAEVQVAPKTGKRIPVLAGFKELN